MLKGREVWRLVAQDDLGQVTLISRLHSQVTSAIELVKDAVEAFDSAWLLNPKQGEVFESAKDYLRRLERYTLSRGFAVVTATSKGRAQFACIHYGVKAKNWRELGNHVTRDKDGNIVTRHKKEETTTNTRDCT
jgi:hypothetical protein